MADQQKVQLKNRPGTLRKDAVRSNSVRYFRKVEVRLVRLGRDLGLYTADFGRLDVKHGTFEFLNNAIALVGGTEVKAAKITLNPDGNQVVAEGRVMIAEKGVLLEADSMVGPPSLAGMKFGGKVIVRADDNRLAETLLRSRTI
jgi:lipopolysaccharide export system protein LptA